jgi:excisionase family DNA binding protein
MATTEEVADHLQLPVHTLEQWRSQGKGPDYHKVGRHVRYDWQDVTKWKNAQKMTIRV